jgi:carbon dioxide concentrating mechanism protein CcmO
MSDPRNASFDNSAQEQQRQQIVPSAAGAKPASADQKDELSVQALQPKSLDEGALGLVCTRSFPAIIGTADMMLKSSGVTLVGYEKTGSGYCTAVVRGGYADVKIAVAAGKKTAEQFDQYVSSMMLPRPWPNLDAVLPISTRFAEFAERSGDFEATGALGMIETRGFPAMVGASDAMMKCANVELLTYETTGSGLCTAIVQGRIGDVTMAVEAGMNEAERIGELHAIMVIPRPLDDLMKALPKPKRMAMEQPLPELAEKVVPEQAIASQADQEIAAAPPAEQQFALPELEERVLVPVELESAQPLAQVQALNLPLEESDRQVERNPLVETEVTENRPSSANLMSQRQLPEVPADSEDN